ncbi:MAG: hypothetical protein AAFR66_22530 [Bacteroidota bacterium]
MANISNVSLQVGRVSSATEFARLTITVSWTSREVSDNYWYLLRGFLVERDDGRDFFDTLPDGNIHWHNVGNLDDFVGTVGSQWVRPNGLTTRTFTFNRNWNFGDQEGGSEEYFGVATIVPETRGDVRFSPEVSANLG